MYGADMKDVELTVSYMLENYIVKNLILNIYIDNGVYYDQGEDTLTNNLHPKVSGASRLSFYGKYLFLNPRYAISKISSRRRDTYLPQPFDVFDISTGAYDKRARDAEPIGSLDEYIRSYPVFADYPEARIEMSQTDYCIKSVLTIINMCREAGVNLTVVCSPVYKDYMAYFDPAQVADFYTKLAEITPYWDFSMSSVSWEPRYFYDGTHFRNAAGTMALARMFGNDRVYVPEDFGVYVTKENVASYLETLLEVPEITAENYTARVPILMYHHLDYEGNDTTTTTPETFEAHMKALRENGYTAISIEELVSYVDGNGQLPPKPVLITFDDGYLSNYELAFPILEKYNMKATIFIIGSSVGKSFYRDTDYPIIPHFDYEQAREMVDSGLVSIQSHTYDMHRWQPFEKGAARTSILKLEKEDENDYIRVLKEDFLKSSAEICENLGIHVDSLAFPNGQYDILSQAVLTDLGVRVTLSVERGINTVIKGLPQSLYAMKRLNMNESIDTDKLLEALCS
jgi:peptidoglycan/xylan/chitin deacetylase (PgdA/CDA1 family)